MTDTSSGKEGSRGPRWLTGWPILGPIGRTKSIEYHWAIRRAGRTSPGWHAGAQTCSCRTRLHSRSLRRRALEGSVTRDEHVPPGAAVGRRSAILCSGLRRRLFMQAKNLPGITARYWIAILAASMCGANTGDFLARNLHLGHARGLLTLAALFSVILWAERRTKTPTEAYYWLAIIVIRTAATN